MRKLLALLLCLLLTAPALAEGPLPEELLIPGQERMTLADAVSTVYGLIGQLPTEHLTSANLVRLSDNTHAWVVSVYDRSENPAANWTYTLSADDGEVVWADAAEGAVFIATRDQWEATLGSWQVWPRETLALYERLYMPINDAAWPDEIQISQEEACAIAMAALEMSNAADYQLGYRLDGTLWQVFFVQEGVTAWQVNVDAASGQVTRIMPQGQGNG